jgi:hypothetical protein
MATGTVVGFLAFLAYFYLNKPLEQTLRAALIVGVIGSVLGNAAGYAWAKLTDKFPQSHMKLVRDHSKLLRDRIYGLTLQHQGKHKRLKLNEEEIASRLTKLMKAWLDRCIGRDERSFVSNTLAALSSIRNERDLTRRQYVGLLDAAMEQARVTLGNSEAATATLEEIAADIRDKEISPSFGVLDETLSRYRAVQERLSAISFT